MITNFCVELEMCNHVVPAMACIVIAEEKMGPPSFLSPRLPLSFLLLLASHSFNLTSAALHQSHSNSPPQQTNFLYIMYDDLRPELSIYGNPHMITPNFERLAKRSVTFDYAFCQVCQSPFFFRMNHLPSPPLSL
jgi:hypothetical protein